MRFKLILRCLPLLSALSGGNLLQAQVPIAQYDFNGTLTPTVGSYSLTPMGIGINYGPDRFGNANSALTLVASTFPRYLNVPTNDDYPQRTVCFWFKAAASTSNNIGMIYESDGPHILNAQTQFGILNNTLDYLVGNNHASAPIVPSKWYFAAIIRSATDVKFYLNCTLVATKTDMSNGHSLSQPSGTWITNARIGNTAENTQPQAPNNLTNPTPAYNYNGSLDDFRIYNVALTPAQLVTVMGSYTLLPSFTIASTFCGGASITANGSASYGTPIDIDHYYWEITESDQYGNIPTGAQTWSSWYAGTPGVYTFPSSNLGGPGFLTCGKYYKVKLVVKNCVVPWVETSKIIHIACAPNITISGPSYVCATSVTSLDATGATSPTSYHWMPGNQTTPIIDVHPATDCAPNCGSGGTTYTVTATNASGCSSTASITVIAAPQNLNLNLSTGVDALSNIIANGLPDPFWKIRGRANSSAGYTTAFANLPNATVVAPYQGTTWASTANASWVTSEAIGAQPNPNAPASNNVYQNTPQFFYWYENRFFIPAVGYKNFNLNISKTTADNFELIYLNKPSTLTIGSAADLIVDNTNHTTFQYLFGPYNITNQSGFLSGQQNILQIGVYNLSSSSYTPTGFLMRANLTANCSIQTKPCHHCQ